MFFAQPEWTISCLHEELNKWTKFKRRQADCVEELPTASDLSSRFHSGILEAHKRSRIQPITSLVEGGFRYEPEPVLFVTCYDKMGGTTLLTLPVLLGTEEKDGAAFAYVREVKEPVFPFPTITGETTLEELFRFAQGRVAAAGDMEPIERWLTCTSNRYRLENPVCPKCGCDGVYIGEFSRRIGIREVDEKRPCCSNCDWVSHRTYSYISDFIDAKNFKRELNYTKAEDRALDRVDAAAKEAQAALQKLYELMDDKLVLHHAGGPLLKSMKDIQKEMSDNIDALAPRL